MTLDEVKRINDRRLAKHGQKYYTDDKVYIGNPDGTLSIYISVPAQFNPTAGTGIDISGQYPNQTITNTAPDQIVDLIAGTNISITGTYPDFTINSTSIASTPGGVDSNVQYNNSGAFGGDSTFTFNDTTKVVGVDALAFNLTPVNAPGNGQIAYVGNTGALAYNLNSSSVTSQIGQTLHAYVHNAESVTITKGQAVYLYQASGNKASVKLAYNTSDAFSAKTFGLAAEDIAASTNGMVICQGVLDGLNTGMFGAGDTLYLSATPGDYTSIKPYAPNHLVYIGVVERANAGNGQIYVRIQNGYELTEIHDVDLITTPPVNNDVLTYVSGPPNLWKAKSISTILGYTPVPDTRTLTINGTAYDLTLDRTWSVGTVTSVTGTSPISSSGGTTPAISIQDAAADNTTKGACTFDSLDFNATAGLIRIDYANAQSASATNKGFVTSTDWSTFAGKQDAITLTTTGTSGAATLIGSTLNIPQYAGTPVAISDEGTPLTSAVTSIDFTGAGVTATVVGSAVTVTINGGGGGTSAASNLFSYYNFI